MTELVISQPPLRRDDAKTVHPPAVGSAFLPWLSHAQSLTQSNLPQGAELTSQGRPLTIESVQPGAGSEPAPQAMGQAMALSDAPLKAPLVDAPSANLLSAAAALPDAPFAETSSALQLLLRSQGAATPHVDRLMNPLLMSSIGQYRLAQLHAGASLLSSVTAIERPSHNVTSSQFDTPLQRAAAVITPLPHSAVLSGAVVSGTVELPLTLTRSDARIGASVASGQYAREDWRAPLAQQHWSMRLRADGWHVRIRNYVTDVATSWRAWTPLSDVVIQSITINGTQVLGGADGYHRRWSAGQ